MKKIMFKDAKKWSLALTIGHTLIHILQCIFKSLKILTRLLPGLGKRGRYIMGCLYSMVKLQFYMYNIYNIELLPCKRSAIVFSK